VGFGKDAEVISLSIFGNSVFKTIFEDHSISDRSAQFGNECLSLV
jgi:hypothetical protein